MSGLGTWVVDGAYSLRWEQQADGTSGELSLGADTGGRAPAHWESHVPLWAAAHTAIPRLCSWGGAQPGTDRAASGSGEQWLCAVSP